MLVEASLKGGSAPLEASLLCLALGGMHGSCAYNDRYVRAGKLEFARGGGEEVEGAKGNAASKREGLTTGETQMIEPSE